ncbi:hypothetical protein CBR_g34469 [Chara braunii]|uniref:PROP1-like PPR domain-containing protein n=1 Tax=Chara braunii TaxID=69332 RepID=A0A388LIU3_CHABU|nr:hypothetical protein CBR_g34469 [Chara braunii]|eukprot:GBG82187.1 hypothetical protein CBR_g34469 [Chara braunii]
MARGRGVSKKRERMWKEEQKGEEDGVGYGVSGSVRISVKNGVRIDHGPKSIMTIHDNSSSSSSSPSPPSSSSSSSSSFSSSSSPSSFSIVAPVCGLGAVCRGGTVPAGRCTTARCSRRGENLLRPAKKKSRSRSQLTKGKWPRWRISYPKVTVQLPNRTVRDLSLLLESSLNELLAMRGGWEWRRGGGGGEEGGGGEMEQDAVSFVHDVMSRCPFRRDVKKMTLLLTKVGNAGRMGTLQLMLTWLERFEDITTDERMYNAVLGVCIRKEDVPLAMEVYSMMVGVGIRPNVYTYNALISTCAKVKDLPRAMEMYGKMRAEGYRPDIVTYNALLSVCERTGKWQQALRFLSGMAADNVKPDVRTCNTVIRTLSAGGQWERALQVLQRMEAAGIRPDTLTYTAMIEVLGKAGRWEEALRRFKELQGKAARNEKGCALDILTWNTIIVCLSDAGQAELALHLYRKMREEWLAGGGCAPDQVTRNAVIGGFSRRGEYKKAARVFQQMLDEGGFVPDVFSYSSLIGACEESRQWAVALEVYEGMLLEGCRPNEVTYRTLLNVLKLCGRGAEMEMIERDMAARGILLREEADTLQEEDGGGSIRSNQLLQRDWIETPLPLSNVAELAEALHCLPWYQDMKPILRIWTGELDSKTVCKVIRWLGKHGNWERAIALLDHLESRGFEKNVILHTQLIGILGRWGQPERAVKVFKSMEQKGVPPTSVTYAHLINALVRGGKHDIAQAYFKEMREIGITPTVMTYSALISSLVKSCQLKEAVKFLNRMEEEDGVEANTVIYNQLIQCCGQCGEWEMALRLFERLKSRGYTPDDVTFTALVRVCESSFEPDDPNPLLQTALGRLYEEIDAAGYHYPSGQQQRCPPPQLTHEGTEHHCEQVGGEGKRLP